MFETLRMIELILPELLTEKFRWNSFRVQVPNTEVIWTKWSNLTLLLSRVYPDEEGLPILQTEVSDVAFRVVKGTVECGVGTESADNEIPLISFRSILSAGSSSEILGPDHWSYTRSLDLPALLVSVYGPPRSGRSLIPESPPLTPHQFHRLMQEFMWVYGACDTQPIPLAKKLRSTSAPDHEL